MSAYTVNLKDVQGEGPGVTPLNLCLRFQQLLRAHPSDDGPPVPTRRHRTVLPRAIGEQGHRHAGQGPANDDVTW